MPAAPRSTRRARRTQINAAASSRYPVCARCNQHFNRRNVALSSGEGQRRNPSVRSSLDVRTCRDQYSDHPHFPVPGSHVQRRKRIPDAICVGANHLHLKRGPSSHQRFDRLRVALGRGIVKHGQPSTFARSFYRRHVRTDILARCRQRRHPVQHFATWSGHNQEKDSAEHGGRLGGFPES
eukprot:scaffold36110_cov65-Phaeocystis_antarctica.AAC.5